MAYDASVDYQALKNSLNARLAATTDEAEKKAIQEQIAAADASRIEKGASNFYGLGQYYNDADKDKIATLMANQSIGNAYDLQKRDATEYFNQAKQGASNEALSRGMARSSFVQDRMANIDTKGATALADIDSAKLTAVYNAKNDILNNYRAYQDKKAAEEKQDFKDNIMAYYGDIQAKINEVQNDGDPSNNWQIQPLQALRQEKLLSQEQQAYDRSITAAKMSGSGGGGSSGGGNGAQTTDTLYQDMKNSGNPELFLYQNYKKYGLNSTGLSSVLKGYNSWATTYTGPKEGEQGSAAWTAFSWAQAALNKGADPNEVIKFLDGQVADGYITEAQKAELMQNLEI